MNKAIIIALVVLLVGGVWVMKPSVKPVEKQNVEVADTTSGVKVSNGSVSVNVGQKLSMVDLRIKIKSGAVGKFETNKDLFNSELLNKVEEDGSTHVVLGIMKATAELPSGEVVVGKLSGEDKEYEISGTVTVPGEGNLAPREIVVGTEGAQNK